MNRELIQQNQQSPQTRMELLKQEVDNLNNGTKTLAVLGTELGLNAEQVRFAEAFCNSECRANGKTAAAEAYGYDLTTSQGKQAAYNTANRLLKHPQVNLLIAILLDTAGFNNEFVDKRLMEIIEQRADDKTAVLAIREYNLVQNRLKATVEVITKPAFDFTCFTEEELKAFIALTEKAAIRYQDSQHIPLLPPVL